MCSSDLDGRRAYKSARAGQAVELKPRTLVIDEIELLDFDPASIRVRVVCSKGTYIRALARDIGQALGSGAHLSALRRTRVGNVRIDDCLSVQQAADVIANVPVEYPEWYDGERKA